MEGASWLRAPFSPRSRRSCASAHSCGELLGQRHLRLSCLAAPQLEWRAMRRTDFCHLTFFVRAPAPRWFSARQTLARPRDRGDRLHHVQADSLRRVARCLLLESSRWALSSRRDACKPSLWQPLSPPPWGHTARAACASMKAAKIARIAFAWTKRVAAAIRGVFHRARTVAPQRPLGRPASDFACIATWPPRCKRSTPFHSCCLLRAIRSQSPVHASRCHRRRASLSLGEAYRLLQPSRHAGTPDERSTLAREWGFRLATRRHQPMPVALVSAVRCRMGNLRATVCTRGLSLPALHLRGRVRPWAEAPEQRQNRAIVDDSRVPSSWCIEHPGRRTESSWGLEDLASPRSGLGLSRMPPREGWHRWKDRGAFRRAGTLTRSEDCSSVRARIGAPSRLLLRGIAWELSRLFHRFCRASLWREKRSKQRDLCEPATENRVGLGRP